LFEDMERGVGRYLEAVASDEDAKADFLRRVVCENSAEARFRESP
jgi:hypothetical protein